MAEQKKSRKGKPATQKQIDALARGRALRDAERARRASDPNYAKEPTHSEKWKQLLSGQLTVKDMDDEELSKGRFRAKDGSFSGRPIMVPSHIVQAITNERIRRAKQNIEQHLPALTQALVDMADDPDLKPEVRLKAITVAMERIMGKAEQTTNLKADDTFAGLLSAALDIDRAMEDEPER